MTHPLLKVDYAKSLAEMLSVSTMTMHRELFLENIRLPERTGIHEFFFRFTRENPTGEWEHAGIEHGLALWEQQRAHIKWRAVYLMAHHTPAAPDEGDIPGAGWFPYLNGTDMSVGEGGLYDGCVYLQVKAA